jgi:hypothetical protein
MINPQIVGYMQKAIMSGLSLQQAKQNLLYAGWDHNDVDEAANFVTQGSWPSTSYEKPITQVAKKPKKSIWPLVIILLVIIGASAGIYYFVKNNTFSAHCEEIWGCNSWGECVNGTQERNCTDISNCKTTDKKPATSQSCVPTTTITSSALKALYMQYKAEFDATNSFSEFKAVVQKYGSANQIENLKQSESLPPALAENVFSMIKSVSPPAEKILEINESISGNSATLHITLKDNSAVGTVTLVMESGNWKIDNESWNA